MDNTKLTALKKCSSGLGFYIFAAILTMNFISIVSILFSLVTSYGENNPPELLFNNVLSLVSFFIVGILYCVISQTSISEILPVRRVKPSLCFKIVAVALAAAFVADYIANILQSNLSLFGIENNVNMTYEGKNIVEYILLVISVAIIPPVSEEFMFRGIILQKLRKYGDGFAVLISAALFGLMHGNIIQIPFAFVVGLAMGFITVKTNSIIPSVITHFCVNFSAVVISIIDDNKLCDIAVADTIYTIFVFIVLIIGIICAYNLSKDKNFFSVKKYEEINFKTRMGALASSVGMIFAFIIFGAELILSVL